MRGRAPARLAALRPPAVRAGSAAGKPLRSAGLSPSRRSSQRRPRLAAPAEGRGSSGRGQPGLASAWNAGAAGSRGTVWLQPRSSGLDEGSRSHRAVGFAASLRFAGVLSDCGDSLCASNSPGLKHSSTFPNFSAPSIPVLGLSGAADLLDAASRKAGCSLGPCPASVGPSSAPRCLAEEGGGAAVQLFSLPVWCLTEQPEGFTKRTCSL